MQLGLVGKPNTGKSSFFVAATLKDVEIADYPFTTIKPNIGVTHVRVKCPHTELGIDCVPSKGACLNGTRFVPAEIIDVAGLVPGAHQGKGLGNQFLDDVRKAAVLIMVLDASGATDKEGNEAAGDPIEDIAFLEQEIYQWVAGIIKKAIDKRTSSIEETLKQSLSGLEIKPDIVETVLKKQYPDGDCLEFAQELWQTAKPMIIAANKGDKPESASWLTKLAKLDYRVVQTSAVYELTLRKAAEAGFISYVPGASEFSELKQMTGQQKTALDTIQAYLKKHGSTGVQSVLDQAVFKLADQIPVFPVEDDGKWADKAGNVLPDCLIVDRSTTAKQLAYAVHTDIGDKFIRAIDAKTKRTLGAEHELKPGGIIKIVSGR
ncbi:MAG: redox-regulated ATPase YchF [Candidatus Altiarchaeota archaeon]|nr:redox-regulated ATPase YchF [Candidatus Altiarchaeota archaeon]